MTLPKFLRSPPTASPLRFCAAPAVSDFQQTLAKSDLKRSPDGEPLQLTKTPFRKQTVNFSQDGSRVYFTQIESSFAWNTYELPLLGEQVPKLFMSNATGYFGLSKTAVIPAEPGATSSHLYEGLR